MSISNILQKLNSRDTNLIPHFSKFSKTISFFLIIILITFLSKNIFAAGNILKEKQDDIEKGNNQEAWLNSAMGNNLVSTLQLVAGKVPFEEDGSVKLEGYIPGGAIGASNNMVATLYSQPVSGLVYIAQIKDNFLGKPTYAQGVAFNSTSSLQPLLPIWKTLRNITYSLFSLVFISIGIMIMLRIKISPQAIVTVQNAVPKLITALILVTFSYAIAGLIIDISNIFLSLCLAIFFSAKGTGLGDDLFGIQISGSGIPIISWVGDGIKWIYNSIAGIFGYHPYSLTSLTNSNFGTLNDLTTRAIPAASGIALGEIAGQVFLGVLLGGIGSFALGGLGKDVAGTIGSVLGDAGGSLVGTLILPLIISLLIVFWLIKLYFGLLKCYITLILKIIIGPLEIGLGAFPNMKMGFSSWIMSIIANISVFPITVIFLVFINYLTDLFSTGNLWAPSQLSLSPFVSTVGTNANIISAGIGIAGIAMLAKLPSMIPEFIFQLKPSPWGKAIGESFAPVNKAASGAGRGGANLAGKYMEETVGGFDENGNTSAQGWRKGVGRVGQALGYFSKK